MKYEPKVSTFPPSIEVGCGVWSGDGNPNHGLMEGPKVSIPSNTVGKVVSTEQPYQSMDQLLYMVRWANGQLSKHYWQELFSIGRFEAFEDYERAVSEIIPESPIKVMWGPQGGFRGVTAMVKFDGVSCKIDLSERERFIWEINLKPMAEKQGWEIEMIHLPKKQSTKNLSGSLQFILDGEIRFKLPKKERDKLKVAAEIAQLSPEELARAIIIEDLNRK